jgi:hypothetical protein
MHKYLSILFLTISFSSFSAIIYVSQVASGLQDGSSWTNSYGATQVQTAINNASFGDEIWISCGTYTPGSNRTDSFSMRNGVSIFGGFLGNEISFSERNLNCGSCSILSGEIGDVNQLFDNSYHVISNQNLDESALINGFQIINGYDERETTGNEGLGGGIYNMGSGVGNFCSPTILYCVFRNNHAGFGGGIFNNGFSGGNASPHIENCFFEENSAFQGGGAIDNFGLDGNASPTIFNCVFLNNSAPTAGAIYCWGGGSGNSSPHILNSTFYGNQATNGNAGAIICDNSDWDGINFSGTSDVTVKNSIFWGNAAVLEGDQFFLKGSPTFSATFSCIDTINLSNLDIISGANTGNIFTDPLFFNPSMIDDCLFDNDDRLHLNQNSPCVNSGDNTEITSEDIAGNQRIYGPNVDMGAYETIELNTKLIEKVSEKIILFPNPCSTQLHFSESLDEFQITNSLGQEILGGNGDFVDLTNLENGIYYLIFFNNSLPIIKLNN